MSVTGCISRRLAFLGGGKVNRPASRPRVVDCSSFSCVYQNGRPTLLYDPSAMTADDAMEAYRLYKAKLLAHERPSTRWERLERERLARS